MSGAWIDKQSLTSVREDGAKVGCFWPDGREEWWGYPLNASATGPYATCEEAKAAVDSALPFGEAEP